MHTFPASPHRGAAKPRLPAELISDLTGIGAGMGYFGRSKKGSGREKTRDVSRPLYSPDGIQGTPVVVDENDRDRQRKKAHHESKRSRFALPSSSRSKPVAVNHAVSGDARRRIHLSRLFKLGNKYVEHVPAERRQSLASTASSVTPPGSIPLERGCTWGNRQSRPQSIEKPASERDSIVTVFMQTASTSCTPSCSIFDAFSESMFLNCGPMSGPGEPTLEGGAELNEILEDPKFDVIPIPRVISFEKRELRGLQELQIEDNITYHLPVTLADRLKRRRQKTTAMPKCRVYVEKPKYGDERSASSVEQSVLTTPTALVPR